jgi:putative DNA primase/helicase
MQPDRIPLSQVYRGRWREILASLGISEKMLVNRHGPCPVCGGRDRFRFDDKDRLGTFFCTHCGAGDGPKLAMLFTGLSFKELADKINGGVEVSPDWQRQRRKVCASSPTREETSESKRQRMNALWGKAMPVRANDPAGRYLASRLGKMPERTGLRFQPHCPYPEGDTWPAMLAVFVGPDGTPSGLHRTYLTPEGRKAPVMSSKLSLGPLIDGGAVRLSPPAPVLGIAEGIETALAATKLFGIPCWAALNANRLAVWEPPAGTREAVIFADNDESFTGQTAAFDLEARLRDRMTVRIEIPTKEGHDWCDVLAEKGRRAA